MATHKPRLNVTLNPDDMDIITLLAEKEHKSMSALARDLIEEALELREDYLLSKLADKRAQEDDNSRYRHEEAWGDL